MRGQALTRPELSVLVSYSKAVLKEQLIESDLGSDAYLARRGRVGLSAAAGRQYGEEVRAHRLHREIMATQLANDIVNRMGMSYIHRQQTRDRGGGGRCGQGLHFR